jgi:hypothetical protein
MDELTENARVWRVYNDEADRRDAEMVEGWSQFTSNIVLVESHSN